MSSQTPSDGEQTNGGDTVSPNLNSAVLGEITWLMAQSELHKAWPVASVMQWVVPALLHNQYRLYRQGDKPIGYVSWGRFSPEVEDGYVRDPSSLQPKDWQSGSRGWILDYIAPFGDALRIGEDLKNNIFANEMGRYLRAKPGSDTMHISYLHGRKMIDKAQDWENNPTVDLGSLEEDPVTPNAEKKTP